MLQITLSCDFLFWVYCLNTLQNKPQNSKTILVKDCCWLKGEIIDKLIYLSHKLRRRQCSSLDQLNAIEDLFKAAIDNKICTWKNLGFKSHKAFYDYILDSKTYLEQKNKRRFLIECYRQDRPTCNYTAYKLLPDFELDLQPEEIQELAERFDDLEEINCHSNKADRITAIAKDTDENKNILEIKPQDISITMGDEFILELKIADIPPSLYHHLERRRCNY